MNCSGESFQGGVFIFGVFYIRFLTIQRRQKEEQKTGFSAFRIMLSMFSTNLGAEKNFFLGRHGGNIGRARHAPDGDPAPETGSAVMPVSRLISGVINGINALIIRINKGIAGRNQLIQIQLCGNGSFSAAAICANFLERGGGGAPAPSGLRASHTFRPENFGHIGFFERVRS